MSRKSWGSVAVGTRVTQNVPSEFLVAWTQMLLQGMRPGDTVLPFPIRAYHHVAANQLVRWFLASDADSILFVDSDQIMKADALHRLRDSRFGKEYDGVMALIAHRKNGLPIVMKRANDDDEHPLYEHNLDYTPGHVVPVDCLGLGFTLYRRSVFEKMPDPWFSFPTESDGIGEDVWFSLKARQSGIRLAVDTAVEVAHLVNEPLTASLVRASMEVA